MLAFEQAFVQVLSSTKQLVAMVSTLHGPCPKYKSFFVYEQSRADQTNLILT